jgi:hypothetical protein
MPALVIAVPPARLTVAGAASETARIREERRTHVHVQHETGEAKFWLDPSIELGQNYGLTPSRVATVRRLIEEHENEIRRAWKAHFGT